MPGPGSEVPAAIMKCDLCDKPAVVHEVVIKGDVKKEVHLCETHAGQHGFAVPMQQPLNQLLTKFVITSASPEARKKPAVACARCGLTFVQFRQSGTLGCPGCYEAFSEHLSPLIERAQAGKTHHIGKSPSRAGQSIDRQLLRQRLVKELQEAVVAEQYERAARLRDRLREVDTPAKPESPPGSVGRSRAPEER
jgi:protein arginine kinase activator